MNKKIEELTEENKKLKELNQQSTAAYEAKVDQLTAELSAIKEKDLFVSGIPNEENLNINDLVLKTIALLKMNEEITMEH